MSADHPHRTSPVSTGGGYKLLIFGSYFANESRNVSNTLGKEHKKTPCVCALCAFWPLRNSRPPKTQSGSAEVRARGSLVTIPGRMRGLLLSARNTITGEGSKVQESDRRKVVPQLRGPLAGRGVAFDQLRGQGTRVGEAAEMALEARQRGLSVMRIPIHSLDAEAQKVALLNTDAEMELERLYAKRAELLESARRAQPAESATPSEHVVLAAYHFCEAAGRAWSATRTGIVSGFRQCCSPGGFGSSSSSGSNSPGRKSAFAKLAGSGSGEAPPRTPNSHRTYRRPGGDDGRASPDKAYFTEAETSVSEAHSKRLMKRTATLKRMSDEEQLEAIRLKRARVLEDKANRVAAENFVWCPTHVSRQAWDLFMLTLIVYSCVIVPYRIGMDVTPVGVAEHVDVAVTIIFITDLMLNFNTAYAEGQYVIIDRGMIARNYLSGWFWIDLLSSFPFDAFDKWVHHIMHTEGQETSQSSLKMLRGLRLFRLLRLLRLLKLQNYLDAIEDRLNMSLQFLQIVKMVVQMLYLMHFLGCFWFYTAVHAAESGYETTWLHEYDGGSGLSENGATVDRQYLYSIYWALMTLTTVGYGDITPANDAERAYALFALLVGALVFGYMLSSIGDLIGSLDKNGARLQGKLDEVKEFTRWHRMDPDLASRVRKYYEFYYSRQGPLDDNEIVSSLAPALKKDVMQQILAQTVCKIPFFYVPALGSTPDDENAPADVDFQLALYPLLKPLVREAQEVVFHKGERDVDPQLTFLFKGSVEAHGQYRGGRRLYTISDQGAFLSEHVLLDVAAEVTYAASYQRCELYVLELSELLGLIERFPHAREEFAHFVLEDTRSHKRQRAWSLRFASRERLKPGLSAYELDQDRLHRAALLLQIGWIKRHVHKIDALVEEHNAYAPVLPTLYGRPPKAQLLAAEAKRQRRLSRVTLAATLAAGGAQVGMLPPGFAPSPRAFSILLPPPENSALGSGLTPPASHRKESERGGARGGGKAAGGNSSRGARSSSPASSARAVLEQLKLLSTGGFKGLEQQMNSREQQLRAISESLSKLAEGTGERGTVTLPPGQPLPPAGQGNPAPAAGGASASMTAAAMPAADAEVSA